ncbi:MAG: RloB domain-containing protein [Desulfobacteraceae bacterium]|nr:RloB domain-containing protein [Desulfobacteraceae bacterium]
MGSDNLHHLKRKGQLRRKSQKLKEYKDSILIICEGDKTEPNYFNNFPVSNVIVKAIGTGKNTVSLVEEAIEKWKEFAHEDKYFEKLWCVFDKDDFPSINYYKAFENVASEERKLNKKFKKRVGRKIEISIAYSNQAFELWYLLHYDYIDSGINRSEYKRMLTRRMGERYEKNNPAMYNFLEQLSQQTNDKQGQNFAISNAKKLRKSITTELKHAHNPATAVDILVEELNRYLKK